MLEKELFVKTNAKTRMHFAYKTPHTSFKGLSAKIQIGASGGYFDLISNPVYSHSEIEKMEDQSDFHKNTLQWHYFKKYILCEKEYYQVLIDVQENKQHEFMVYNVSLSELKNLKKFPQNEEKELINSMPEDTDLRDKFFHTVSISKNEHNVNENIKNQESPFNKAIKKDIKPNNSSNSLDGKITKAQKNIPDNKRSTEQFSQKER